MLKNTQVFISYRRSSKEQAGEIAKELEDGYGYQVFWDVKDIQTADEWEKTIYHNIRRTDVLILLLEPEAANSEWMQREVDVARGIHVAVLPLPIVDPAQNDLSAATEKLAIDKLQYSGYFRRTPDDYRQLVEDIDRLTKVTRDAQRIWMTQSQERWRVLPPIDHDPEYRTFWFKPAPRCKIHLAIGDIFRMGRPFDVIVNTENDYLQMARYFEHTTLSGTLRRLGSKKVEGCIVDDTLQDELNQLANKRGRPVKDLQVFATHAGHPESDLRRIARYVFHAVAVRFTYDTTNPILPIKSNTEVREITTNCLNKVIEVNRNRGIHLSKAHRFSEPTPYEPIKSIILPIFGTGQGGRAIMEIAPHMVEGIYDFLKQCGQDKDFTVENLHLCVYSASEVEAVEACLKERF